MDTKDTIVTFLQKALGDKPAVIGLSGGIDSATVAYLLAESIQPQRIHGIIMPSENTSEEDIADAEQVAKMTGITVSTIPIQPLMEAYAQANKDFSTPRTLMNLQPRIRMTLLYGKANAIDGLVIGTGNKSELQIGYFTKYGDGGVDLLPIGDLYKYQVYELAKELGVPESIISKAPSAGLFAGQTDEDELGLSYKELDAILEAIEKNSDLSKFDPGTVQHVQQLKAAAQHKLELPPIAPTG